MYPTIRSVFQTRKSNRVADNQQFGWQDGEATIQPMADRPPPRLAYPKNAVYYPLKDALNNWGEWLNYCFVVLVDSNDSNKNLNVNITAKTPLVLYLSSVTIDDIVLLSLLSLLFFLLLLLLLFSCCCCRLLFTTWRTLIVHHEMVIVTVVVNIRFSYWYGFCFTENRSDVIFILKFQINLNFFWRKIDWQTIISKWQACRRTRLPANR